MQLNQIQALLQLPKDEFLRIRLQRAIERQDNGAVIDCTIGLKGIMLESDDLAERKWMELSTFSKLRSVESFSTYYGVVITELAHTMLKWTDAPLHTSLTMIQDSFVTIAVHIFKNILGIFGDRQYSFPQVRHIHICFILHLLLILYYFDDCGGAATKIRS